MPDDFTKRLEQDLARFRARTAGSELENLRTILHDYSLSWEQLRDAISPLSVQFLLALLAPDIYGLSGSDIPAQLSAEVASARILAKRELQSFLKHPAIAQDLAWHEEYQKGSERADDALYRSPMVHISEDAYFEEEDGKLVPRVRLAMATRNDEAVLVTDNDSEDILLLADKLINVARRELERCVPMAEKDMLKLNFGELVGPALRSINDHLGRICELAARLGIELEEEDGKPVE